MNGLILICFAVFVIIVESVDEQVDSKSFVPICVKLGSATSAYQVEGAQYEDGRTANIWDTFLETNAVLDGSNAKIAADSYHKYKEDVQNLKFLGVDTYEFSISWSRFLPDIDSEKPNKQALLYYKKLIKELIENNIEPKVTLYHHDLPAYLEKNQGWLNATTINYFKFYANKCFKYFGKFVKTWKTFSQPRHTCLYGYGEGFWAPGKQALEKGQFECGKNILLAHASAVHLYNEKYRLKQRGKIGIAVDCNYYKPLGPTDQEAADRAMAYTADYFLHPIFSTKGDYNPIVKQNTLVPAFTEEEIKFIKRTGDFIAISHFGSYLVSNKRINTGSPSWDYVINAAIGYDPSWPSTSAFWFKVYPEGIKKVLLWLKTNYPDYAIHITKFGYADFGEINDVKRKEYYESHLKLILQAIHDHAVKIEEILFWSLMDSFEWDAGYSQRYGLFSIDFTDPARTRKAKYSAEYIKEVCKSRKP